MTSDDTWDAARDRITETNQAIRAERERCAQLAGRLWGSRFAERLREDHDPTEGTPDAT
jgi:hypothetical protein